MVYDWEAFEPIDRPPRGELFEEDMLMKWFVKGEVSGEEYTLVVMSMIGLPEHYISLCYCVETDKLSVYGSP